jgi:GT2 family glycosyltransferase
LKTTSSSIESPLVSIVIVRRNSQDRLERTFRAIEQQSYKGFEVVFVDDGHPPASAATYVSSLSWSWWQKEGWKVVNQPTGSLAESKNLGGIYSCHN